MKALDTARAKGIDAAMSGKSESDCPYRDKRTYRGRVTFSRAFMKAWLEGFRSIKRIHK